MFRNTLTLVACVAVASLATPVLAGTFNSASGSAWDQSYTDASGNYQSPVVNGTVTGGVLSTPISTNASQSAPDNDVVNYVRTRTDIPGASAAYNGTLLGNLSGKSSVTATFNISNSALTPGQQFTLSQLVGETNPGGFDPAITFSFTGTAAPTAADSLGAGNQWWSTTPMFVTAMTNGDDVTLTVDFDPANWINVNGKQGDSSAAETLDFENALADVKFMGLSFGSGSSYSDGFAFNTGGNASFNMSSFDTTPNSVAVPAPASLWSLATLIAVTGVYRMVRRPRPALACSK